MSGAPDDAGPPEWVDVPDRAAVHRVMKGRKPPYGVRFRRGEETAEERVVEMRADRGGQIVELDLESGQTVTVNAERELEAVR